MGDSSPPSFLWRRCISLPERWGWPPTGIALAFALILGPSSWMGIFLGAFLVNQTTAGTVATSMVVAAGNTFEALVAAYAVNRYAGGRAVFETSRHTLLFVILAG